MRPARPIRVSPTIEAANVEIRVVRGSQNTPSISPYHMTFAMLECILRLPKKGG